MRTQRKISSKMKLKFKPGDILTVKKGYKINVNKFLTTWVSLGNIEDHEISHVTSKDVFLVCKVWTDSVGPYAYECVFDKNRGFIFAIENNEDYLIKVN